QSGENSVFFKPLKQFPSGASEAEQKRLRDAVLKTISDQIIPAYERFSKFVRAEYAPTGRVEPGVWAMTDGEARYQYEIRRMTSTDLTPDQIHAIGLNELHKTEAEMLGIAKQFGFNDLASFNQHIKNDRKQYATSGQQVLDLYAKYV